MSKALSQIPQFPNFSPFSLDLQNELTQYVSRFPCYSDFNFTVLLWANIYDDVELSYLNDNLVVLFKSYIVDHPVYSFLGVNNVDETVATLVERSREAGYCDFLKHVPEISLTNFKNVENYKIQEDLDCFDYVYSVENHANLTGVKFENKRTCVNRFLRDFPNFFLKINNCPNNQDIEELLELAARWGENSFEKHEVCLCLEKLLAHHHRFPLEIASLYSENMKMVGFRICEPVGSHIISHFCHCDPIFKDAAAFLTKQHSVHLLHNGYEYINWMQDLGLPKLRQAKHLWRPSYFLKKYIVRANFH